MPSGTGSGIVSSVTFTPSFTGQVEVTCSWRAAGTGSGSGQVRVGKLFLTQSSTTTYSPGRGVPNRAQETSQVERYLFSVTSGSSVEAGLYGEISGAVAVTWRDISIAVRKVG